MSHKISKSAGWSFKTPKQEQSLIQYNSKIDPIDSRTLSKLLDQIHNLSVEDVTVLFNILPPVEQLIQQIPYTLPLLQAVYVKCELKSIDDGIKFPSKELHCEPLFGQLVWWTAYCDQAHVSSAKKCLPSFDDMQPYVATLMQVLVRQVPGLVKRAYEDKAQLTCCLESLGCHGLVNCSSGLIRMPDAVHLELVKHIEKLRSVSLSVRELTDQKVSAPGKQIQNPSCESHQRQMNMRLSQVFERLKLNETIQCVLEDTLQNQHLTSLLRIIKKRVASDKLFIGLFNAFARAAPDDFCLQQMDPVVAQLIVVFNNAYEKLLSLGPVDTLTTSTSSGSSAASSVSSGNTRSASIPSSTSSSAEDDSKQCNQLKAEILKLRKELRVANYTIAQVREKSMTKENKTKECTLPTPDYPDATALYNCSSKEQISQIAAKFGELFIYASNDLMTSLRKVPGLDDDESYQYFAIHQTLKTSYETVSRYLEEKRNHILRSITNGNDIKLPKTQELNIFDRALYNFFYKEYKTRLETVTNEEMTITIWDNLSEYPLLKLCPEAHLFVKKCIEVCWEVLCGVDKTIRLEHVGTEFDETRHSRGAYSGSGSKIKRFLWPALVDIHTDKVYLKAIVLT